MAFFVFVRLKRRWCMAVARRDRLAAPDACRTEGSSSQRKVGGQQYGAPAMTVKGDRKEGCGRRGGDQRLAVLSPLVLATDLVLLLRSEVVLDVEGLADLLGGLAFDHVCDRLAADVEKGLDVEVVGGLWWC